jgi:hypothetical protein
VNQVRLIGDSVPGSAHADPRERRRRHRLGRPSRLARAHVRRRPRLWHRIESSRGAGAALGALHIIQPEVKRCTQVRIAENSSANGHWHWASCSPACAATRAYDLTIERMPQHASIALTNSMAHHPEAQPEMAEMRVAYDPAEAMLEPPVRTGLLALSIPTGLRLVATRHFAMDQAYAIVDRALDLSGGAGAFKRNAPEQTFRNVRMGRFHAGNTLLAHK